jgi:sirohydrochlorin ferrochelatase
MTAFNLDPARYEGHTAALQRSPTAKRGLTILDARGYAVARVLSRINLIEEQANGNLFSDTPQILAEALRLKAENERLKEKSAADWSDVASRLLAAADEIERLKAENERLRETVAWHEIYLRRRLGASPPASEPQP